MLCYVRNEYSVILVNSKFSIRISYAVDIALNIYYP